ncbi:cystatin-F [Takifugu rubripes]|nr:cystatin-F [Takifugu rubripes]|eukprot:XP_011601516.1 PREDICTED: cystatin-F [Takifugu rubripes]
MMGMEALLFVALIDVVLVLAGRHNGQYLPGAPVNISKDDVNLKLIIHNATCMYNNQSNDAFLFKPSAIITAQQQIVKGIKYFVNFQISRTVCRKKRVHTDLSTCDFQPEGLLHQTLQCHFEAWLIPWKNICHVKVLSCKS